jgi:hypothetical protein
MRTITVDNVNEALPIAMHLLASEGEPHTSRAGSTLRLPEPVATIYTHPSECVLFDPKRNANPFFHFFEALWILQGRNDVGFLELFNKRMPEFSDDRVTFHGAYGARLRSEPDQVDRLITLLYEQPETRRGALQIWDHTHDLGSDSKDVPCNMMAAFRRDHDNRLHMTVFNRSNDVIWGAYGTNAVQFGLLLEYVAARAGMGVGTYTQISNDFHVYEDNPFWQHYVQTYGKHNTMVEFNPYTDGVTAENLNDMHGRKRDASPVRPYYLFRDPLFDVDLENLFNVYDGDMRPWPDSRTDAMANVIIPMYDSWVLHKVGKADEALAAASTIAAEDWRLACELWLIRAAHNKGAV